MINIIKKLIYRIKKNDVIDILDKELPELQLLFKYRKLVTSEEYDKIQKESENRKQTHESIRSVLSKEDIKSLFTTIDTSNELNNLEKLDLISIMMGLLAGRYPKTNRECKLLEKVFGKNFVDTIILKNKEFNSNE